MNIKSLARNYAPPFALRVMMGTYKCWQGFAAHSYDKKSFRSARYRKVRGAGLSQLEGKLTFHSHSLEKGLSHKDMRYNFGSSALIALAETIEEYKRQGYAEDRLPYINAISTLRAYYDCHVSNGLEAVELERIFDPKVLDEVSSCNSDIGGATVIESCKSRNRKEENFAELFTGRVSIREFDDAKVEVDRILSAIQLSMKAPSVCNRQSARVHIVTGFELIERILRVQGGMNGYATPPALIVVTAELSSFLEPTERNQPFIDGGLFAMSLLLSLEYEELAACPLNAMMTPSKESQIRTILDLPPSERLVLFIATGEFAPSVKVPKSFRLRADDISRTHR